LGVGNASLTASYTGTGNFANSTSAAAALTVNRAATAVALTPSLNPAVTGQAVTFTATVSVLAPGMGLPTGTVTFMDGNLVLGTAQVSPVSGKPTLTTSVATAGGHAVTAVYSGDTNLQASPSAALTEQVNAPTPPATTPPATTPPATTPPATTPQATTSTTSLVAAA